MPNPFGTASSDTLGYESRADSLTVAQFFNMVYAWMASGLALTAVVAWWVSTHPQALSVLRGPGLFILFIAQLGLVWTISAAIYKINSTTATLLFLLYSALNGVLLSVIFLVYAHATIAAAFVVTAGTFAAMSAYGFLTKRDLTSLGSILFMALIGLIIASVVNVFWANSTLYWIITYAGVLIFVGLTAYDTQKLRQIAQQTSGNPALASRLAISGALALYLDFINLFLMLLRILGNQRR
jgi:FtsH-binding integral membrane protein